MYFYNFTTYSAPRLNGMTDDSTESSEGVVIAANSALAKLDSLALHLPSSRQVFTSSLLYSPVRTLLQLSQLPPLHFLPSLALPWKGSGSRRGLEKRSAFVLANSCLGSG
jgi:hypothetical protein